ncbi:ATP-binding protein [Cytobacillus horneckiae]|uniref:ATP-binding protein n=1 Tax=Cytobacillus horneckiae TaxID=549687 RepID=UPI003D9A2DEB
MRDVLVIPFSPEESIVIASDNSGGIGLKKDDVVAVPYEIVSYYAFRVAMMECIAASAIPFSVTLQNFCGDDAWAALTAGIEKGLSELGMAHIPLTGSTESNFTLKQSAVGISVMGRVKNNQYDDELLCTDQTEIAIIGKPLVGNEVIEQEEAVAPLSLCKRICDMPEVNVLPVGSKGILAELNMLFSNRTFTEASISCELDLLRSSGPATCFIAVFPSYRRGEIEKAAGGCFHKLFVK